MINQNKHRYTKRIPFSKLHLKPTSQRWKNLIILHAYSSKTWHRECLHAAVQMVINRSCNNAMQTILIAEMQVLNVMDFQVVLVKSYVYITEQKSWTRLFQKGPSKWQYNLFVTNYPTQTSCQIYFFSDYLGYLSFCFSPT